MLGSLCYLIALVSQLGGLYVVAYVILSYDVFYKACKNLCHKELFDENFLMIIATLGAFIIKQYPEAVVVMLFYQIGESLSDYAVANSREKIVSLMDLRSDRARLIIEGQEKIVPPEEVAVGDILLVQPGEKIPLDGKIVKGNASLDMKSLTGEAMYVEVFPNQEVLSGSIVLNRPLYIEVQKPLASSTVTKILDLIENVTESKTITERFITRFAKVYTPVVCFLSLLLFLVPTLFFQGEATIWGYRALVFLVISCPCALVISVPLGFFCGIGRATKEGVLVKSTSVLEDLSHIGTFLYDKTGTLTEGRFVVTEVKPVQDFTKDQLLEWTKAAELFSTHPLAKALQLACSKTISKKEVSQLEERAGFGITCFYQGKKLLVGNEKMLQQAQIDISSSNLGTVIYIVVDDVYAGSITLNDVLKDTSKQAVCFFRDSGVEQVMLTGDNRQLASHYAKKLGISYRASLLPADKVKIVQQYVEKSDQLVAFVGDGINDAPALVSSDIGISMGSIGSDAAIEASDVVLMEDDLLALAKVVMISRYTNRKVRVNIIFALAVKVIILILGSVGFASIWWAVFADVGVSLLAILNSLLILRLPLKDY